MDRVIVDCSVVYDEQGRKQPALETRKPFTQSDQDEYDARQLLPKPLVGLHAAAGRVAVAALEGRAKPVAFVHELRSADYVVMLSPLASMSIDLWATNKTTGGFTLNLSIPADVIVEYIAHEVT